jgi:WASH complex subunit 7
LLYDVGVSDRGTLEDGESQLMIGRMLPLLQDLVNFVNRIYAVVKNIVWQLSSFHSESKEESVMNSRGIHLEPVFEHLGDALRILVTLDSIFADLSVFRAHWNDYKRVVTSVGGAPEEYGVQSDKLRPFEKLLQSIEGKLMDGQILSKCVQQIFDHTEIFVTQNAELANEFLISINELAAKCNSKLMSTKDNVEFVQERCVTVCALLVLHYNIYNDYDRKVVRLVWDLHKSVSL